MKKYKKRIADEILIKKLKGKGADNLKKIINKIDIEKMKKPSFGAILVATGTYPYKRDNNILVIPIGCLKN